jgi:hypothetical protein
MSHKDVSDQRKSGVLTSRERVRRAIHHKEPDRIPLDLGSTLVTGIKASIYAQLKNKLGIKSGNIKVYDPFQMLAEVEDEVKKVLRVDTYGIQLPVTIFGYRNEDWKTFQMIDGTEVLISGRFEYDMLENGDLVQYPKGDRSAPPSGKMPKDGFYFDTIVRQEPIEESRLDPKEWVEQTYDLYTEEDLKYLEKTAQWYFENTDYALLGNFWGAGFGDIAIVPGPHIKYPKGIRDPEEWFLSLIIRKQYIKEIFQYQLELQMKNLKMYKEAVGDKIEMIVMSGTDFGAQNGPFISPDIYREVFKPLHKEMNDWVHKNTNWKTFLHSCGSDVAFLDDFISAGVDILNPVQISAAGMDPVFLKNSYGDKLVFWGGGVDTQNTLPFGTPEDVKKEVENNMTIFGKDGGFVFNTVHNIQATVPIDNLIAMFETVREKGSYSDLNKHYHR